MYLALDLGTLCGYAKVGAGGIIHSGTLVLKQQRNESPGMRYIRFENYLADLLEDVTLVAFEDIRFHGKKNSSSAAHIYGAMKAILQMACDKRKKPIPYTGFTPSEIKRTALGKGGGPGTDKDAMIAAAAWMWPDKGSLQAKKPSGKPKDGVSDEADALWILETLKARFPRANPKL